MYKILASHLAPDSDGNHDFRPCALFSPLSDDDFSPAPKQPGSQSVSYDRKARSERLRILSTSVKRTNCPPMSWNSSLQRGNVPSATSVSVQTETNSQANKVVSQGINTSIQTEVPKEKEEEKGHEGGIQYLNCTFHVANPSSIPIIVQNAQLPDRASTDRVSTAPAQSQQRGDDDFIPNQGSPLDGDKRESSEQKRAVDVPVMETVSIGTGNSFVNVQESEAQTERQELARNNIDQVTRDSQERVVQHEVVQRRQQVSDSNGAGQSFANNRGAAIQISQRESNGASSPRSNLRLVSVDVSPITNGKDDDSSAVHNDIERRYRDVPGTVKFSDMILSVLKIQEGTFIKTNAMNARFDASTKAIIELEEESIAHTEAGLESISFNDETGDAVCLLEVADVEMRNKAVRGYQLVKESKLNNQNIVNIIAIIEERQTSLNLNWRIHLRERYPEQKVQRSSDSHQINRSELMGYSPEEKQNTPILTSVILTQFSFAGFEEIMPLLNTEAAIKKLLVGMVSGVSELHQHDLCHQSISEDAFGVVASNNGNRAEKAVGFRVVLRSFDRVDDFKKDLNPGRRLKDISDLGKLIFSVVPGNVLQQFVVKLDNTPVTLNKIVDCMRKTPEQFRDGMAQIKKIMENCSIPRR